MNKLIYLVLLYFTSVVCAQTTSLKVGSNPYNTINSSAALELESTTKGFLPPRMTFDQRNKITQPTDGLIIYCTNCPSGSRMQYYTDSSWQTLSKPDMTGTYIKDRNYDEPNNQHKFIYKTITLSNGTTWLTNNLGCNYANENSVDFFPDKQASAINDYRAYGSLFQWGRAADGHELISYATNGSSGTPVNDTANTLSMGDDPNNSGKFILNITGPSDWRVSKNDNLWQGVNGINNPCPIGFRVPTLLEHEKWKSDYLISNAITGLQNPLKFPSNGKRDIDGSIKSVGSTGLYWTATVISNESFNFYIGPSRNLSSRATGLPIRCIKN